MGIYFFLRLVCTTLNKIGGTSDEKINGNLFFSSLGLHYLCKRFKACTAFDTLCACGEIGRRARLRIWCFATCRFESYQAHKKLSMVIEGFFIILHCFYFSNINPL